MKKYLILFVLCIVYFNTYSQTLIHEDDNILVYFQNCSLNGGGTQIKIINKNTYPVEIDAYLYLGNTICKNNITHIQTEVYTDEYISIDICDLKFIDSIILYNIIINKSYGNKTR